MTNPITAYSNVNQVREASDHTLTEQVRTASDDDLRATPVEHRVALVEELLEWAALGASYDDSAAVSRLITTDPNTMVPALHKAGILRDVIRSSKSGQQRGLQDLGRHGFLFAGGLWRDYPSATISDAKHRSRAEAAIIQKGGEEVARIMDAIDQPRLAMGIRGRNTRQLSLEPPTAKGALDKK